MKGYVEATKIDDRIQILMKRFPIEENLIEWLKLSRTVKTTCGLIEEYAESIWIRPKNDRTVELDPHQEGS